MVVLEQRKFPEPYQYKTVAAGAVDTVWYMPVTAGFVAFIRQVYVKFFSYTWLELIIDGSSVQSKIEHEIGSLASPKEYDPELVAYKWIRVVAHNDDSSSHTYEAVIDGILARPVSKSKIA